MRSLQIWSGLPLLFFTLNPADVKHPFTLLYSSAASTWDSIRLPPCDDDVLAFLTQWRLSRLVAKDPVAAVKAFETHVRLFFEELLGCSCTPSTLHSDGIAAHTGGATHISIPMHVFVSGILLITFLLY